MFVTSLLAFRLLSTFLPSTTISDVKSKQSKKDNMELTERKKVIEELLDQIAMEGIRNVEATEENSSVLGIVTPRRPKTTGS